MQKFIGRHEEKAVLQKALQSNAPEMVAVIGRRRVGKTFLVHSVYEGKISFDITGIQNATSKEQLQNFANRLNFFAQSEVTIPAPTNWLEAFQMLIDFLEKKKAKQEKLVLFFDELPWLSTRRSGFLKAFGFFWNSWAARENIVVVICGSAASWMIQKVVRDKGGLHNRITRRIHLEPFNLAETEAFLLSRNARFDRYQILQFYMAMGGIPHYLKEIEGGKSAAQNIDHICFSKVGLLREEFHLLYPSLFENAEEHIKIIRILATKKMGMTRQEIIKAGKLSNGGTTTRILEELEHSGFISSFYAFGKKKKAMHFRLTDEYSLFYLKFIENQRVERGRIWENLAQTQAYKSWSGYAFESICLKHTPQIKTALGIAGIYSESSVYTQKGKEGLDGVQIDLLIDRKDHVINLFELKFYSSPFVMTKAYAEELRKKLTLFKHYTGTKKQVFLTFLTTFGVLPNEHALGLIDKELKMELLFHTQTHHYSTNTL